MTFRATERRHGMVLIGKEDGAHAALADFAGDQVASDAGTRALGQRRVRGQPVPGGEIAAVLGPRLRVLRRRVEEVARLLVGAEQGLDKAAEIGVAGAGGLQVSGAVGGRGLLQCRHEDRFFTHGRASQVGTM